MTYPSVTFIVAAKDAEATVTKAVRSAVNQRFDGPLKVIAVDDGSSDRTLAMLEVIPGISVITNVATAGRAGARNRALALVDTEFVAIQDADDESDLDRLATCMDELLHTGATAVGAQVRWVDPRRGQYHGARWPTDSQDACAILAAGRMPIAHPTMLIRTAALRAVGGYSAKYPVAEDLDLLLRIKAWDPSAIFSSVGSAQVSYRRSRVATFAYGVESSYWRSVVLLDNGLTSALASNRSIYWSTVLVWFRQRARAIWKKK